MGIFDKFNKPVFLKEDSDTKDYIEKLELLKSKANGQLVQRLDKEIKIAGIGELGEANFAFELKNSGMPMYIIILWSLEK